ncbi:SDH family Clp fold serine proteinase [Nitrospirillum sp. BR 11828]|uniref:SDH family Clp fold serine proteinase n=1 Tax=Nitrospirillum sp. BR 11828 TaxID=3104325 RepID=UPI002ACACB4A|nr:ATP-dependent Clp protease proteolytic subunit [Nitrospirillum sp. BR 11828]MDZ5649752.1 ATP-dependent Clp protease proteolytic subunit [Nitrospirillum sp. BR 11828]
MIIRSPIKFGLDDAIRQEIENLYDDENDRKNTLVVILETTGGYIEVVERIYNVFRNHYQHVSFIVPNYAYSAGTVLVLSGDDIYMDYYSVLGPIDPQMESENDKFVSGLGYLAKFKELLTTINAAPSPDLARAELAYLLKKFDPAELFDLEQAKNHSEDLLESWLSTHKFKDWAETETSKTPVSETDRRARAKKIAEILGNPERWHSHGRGIGLKELVSDEIKLKIVDFGAQPDLNKLVRSYYELFIDYCRKLGVASGEATVIHTRNGIRRI